MARLARLRHRRRRPCARPLPARPAHGARAGAGRRRARRWSRTDYINTIPPEQEPWFPGDEVLERRIRAYIRWNAMAMVDRSNHRFDAPGRSPLDVRVGGRRSTTSASTTSSAARRDGGVGDQVFFQGHAAPGVYARAFLEGRLNEEQLDRFRREVDGGGLPSYPHPRRMPDVLGVPDRVDGPRPAQRGRTRRASTATCSHREIADTSAVEGVGVRRRRRDGRARGDGRAVDRGTRAARQPDLRRQLQPAAARRPGARQRQDHPGARGDLPRRGLERDQGDLGSRAGTSCSPATSTACSSTR